MLFDNENESEHSLREVVSRSANITTIQIAPPDSELYSSIMGSGACLSQLEVISEQ
jgi:hypothetical protein